MGSNKELVIEAGIDKLDEVISFQYLAFVLPPNCFYIKDFFLLSEYSDHLYIHIEYHPYFSWS